MTRKLLSLAVASAIVGAAALAPRAGVRAERRNRGAQGAARRAVGQDRPAREVADADQEDRRRDAGDRRQDRRRGRAGKVAPVVRRRPALPQRSRSTCSTWTAIAIVIASARASMPTSASTTRSPACSASPPADRIRVRPTRRSPTRIRARTSSSTWRTCTWAPNADWQHHRRQAALSLAAHRQPVLRRRHQSRRHRDQLHQGQFLRRRVLRLAGRARAVVQQRDHRHQHRLDHVRRRRSDIASRSRTRAPHGGRHVLRLRRRAGLQPVLRRQLLRQHHDAPAPRCCNRTLGAGVACLLSDFDIIEGFADLTATVGGRPLRFFVDYAQNTGSRSESGGAARSWIPRWPRASATAPRPRLQGHLGIRRDCTSRSRRTRCSASCSIPTSATATPTRTAIVLRGGYTRGPQLDAQRHAVPQRPVQRRSAVGDGVQRGHPGAATTPPVITGIFDRDYKRLQLDLNFRF